jgi:group I intron endonuclease
MENTNLFTEKDLSNFEEIEETDLSNFEEIEEADLSNFEEIEEADLSNFEEIEEADLSNFEEIEEADLSNFEEIEEIEIDPDNIYIVYETINNINGKKYIGSHKVNIEKKDYYLGSGAKLLEDFKIYGRNNFTKRILGIFNTEKESLNFETILVTQEVIDDPMFYNIYLGGKLSTGQKLSEEHKSSMRKPKSSLENYRKPKSEAHKLAMRKPKSEAHKLAMRKPRSEQQKENMSRARAGKVFMNDGTKNYLISPVDVEHYIENGYSKGKVGDK